MTLTLLSTPFSRKLFCPLERTPLAEKPPPTASRAPFSAATTPGRKACKVSEDALAGERHLADRLRIQIGAERGALGLQDRSLCGTSMDSVTFPTGSVIGTPTRSPPTNTTFF